MKRPPLVLFVFLVVSAALAGTALLPAAAAPPAGERPEVPRSSMGALFSGQTPVPSWLTSVDRPSPYRLLRAPGLPLAAPAQNAPGEVDVTPGGPRFQSETTVAARGDTVVVGYNDASGFFNANGISVSGFSYSHDGGQTYTYGGQLPILANGDAVRGDPDVKVWVDPVADKAVFVYSSLYATSTGNSSLCVHVSSDGGATWSAPREATPATSASDFPDKEFLSVDRETGRIMLSWTNFGAATTMRCVTSDDFGSSWSPATVFSARPEDGQGSCPRFDPTSDRAYIVWWAFGSPNTISFVRSSDNAATWSAPVDIVSGIVSPLPPYGSDRINGYPSLSVSPIDGSLHLVYTSMQTADFGDVWYTSSADSGDTWTAPVILNTNPGFDRSQFFAWVNAGPDGGIDVIWYDQRIGTEGSDLTETMHTHSEDGGLTWSCPAPLTARPWHAEYGQDTGQPNIGDYNQVTAVMDGGSRRIHASYARTDGADYQTDFPDTYCATRLIGTPRVGIEITGTAVDDIGCTNDGVLVAGEGGTLTVDLANGCAGGLTNLYGMLSTTNTSVTLLEPDAVFQDLAALGTGSNTGTLRLNVDGDYACGEDLELRLTGTSDQGEFLADFSLPTGVVVTDSLLLSEDFEGVASGLPAGWTHSQYKGVNNPWEVTSLYAASGSQSVFCQDRPDTNWSRLTSPAVAVPASSDLVEVSFVVTYDIEAVGNGRQGWDGALMRIVVDGTNYLAGSFSTLFQGQYRTQIVRGSGSLANPLQDLSAWSGNTLPNFEAIRIRYPGLAGHTIQIGFEMGSDGSVGGTGMFVDDVTVRGLDLDCGSCTSTTGVGDGRGVTALVAGPLAPNPLRSGTRMEFSLPVDEPVWASVYDTAGRRVRVIHDGVTMLAGAHVLDWDGRDDRGAAVGSGIYFIALRTPAESHTAKAVVVR